MRLLIDLGADAHALSSPTSFFISRDLGGHSLTPCDIARIHGPKVFSAYLEALKVKKHEVYPVNNEKEDSCDPFWPALEQLPG